MISPLEFFARLHWINGHPLLDTIEPYRREMFVQAFDTFNDDGSPRFHLLLPGRGSKDYRSGEPVLAGLYSLLIKDSAQGSDGFILGNDEDQAAQDLSLAKKLITANDDEIGSEVEILKDEVKRV